jgi:uncharacterized protein with PIN domain
MHVRVCRDCGEEYRPEISVCADCGGTLEDRYEDEDGAGAPPPEGEPTGPPPPDLSGHRVVFSTTQANALVPLAEALRATGLAFVLNETRPDDRRPYSTFGLFVRDEDAESALRTLAPLLGAEGDPERLHAVESAFRTQGGYERCPACEAALPPEARECPECGLGLAGESAPSED